VLPPKLRIDSVVSIERRDDHIGDVSVALGVTRFACKLDTNLPKLSGKGCIQDRLGMDILRVGSLLVFRLKPIAPYDCSAVVATGLAAAAGFFRLRMMIVVSGTICKGRTPFNG